MREVTVRPLVPGAAAGPACILDEPVSFWGGVDPATGSIVDVRHPQRGRSVVGTVLVMPVGRGSSSASSVLAEMVRLGTAPAAFVLLEPDEIIALGCLVGDELYGRPTPVVLADADAVATIVAADATIVAVGDHAVLTIDGERLSVAT